MKKGEIKFIVNGEDKVYSGDPLMRLLDYLREELGFMGSKEGCGEGECGACSIFLDGKFVNSCMISMGSLHGKKVTTIEEFRETKRGACIIEAFADAGAVQCGFCTPGMVLAAETILQKNPQPTEQEIRIGLSGNLCRCTGYDHIIKAVNLASERGAGLW